MQLFEQSTINLPESDPAIIKLLLDFLYEAEYEPRLAKAHEGQFEVAMSRRTNKGYHYKFPHTCKKGPKHQQARCIAGQVCPHHQCKTETCKYGCLNLICGTCTGFNAADVLLHAKMCAIADKYSVKGLSILASDKLARVGENFWNYKVFPQAVEYALSSTSKDSFALRNALSKIIVSHVELLLKPEIVAIMEKHCGFAFMVVKRQAAELSRVRDELDTYNREHDH